VVGSLASSVVLFRPGVWGSSDRGQMVGVEGGLLLSVVTARCTRAGAKNSINRFAALFLMKMNADPDEE
jgi:hypothetical protein